MGLGDAHPTNNYITLGWSGKVEKEPLKPFKEDCALKSLKAFQEVIKQSNYDAKQIKNCIVEIYSRYNNKLCYLGRIINAFKVYVLQQKTTTSRIDKLVKRLLNSIENKIQNDQIPIHEKLPARVDKVDKDEVSSFDFGPPVKKVEKIQKQLDRLKQKSSDEKDYLEREERLVKKVAQLREQVFEFTSHISDQETLSENQLHQRRSNHKREPAKATSPVGGKLGQLLAATEEFKEKTQGAREKLKAAAEQKDKAGFFEKFFG